MRRILIVDDLAGNRELLSDILQDYYEVETAADGQEAIDLIAQKRGYSAMLLDLMMPKVDGFGVLNYMWNNGLSSLFPVIVISGDSSAVTEGKCLDMGVDDFIAKPFKEKIILKRLKNVISLREYENSLEGQIVLKNAELEEQNRMLIEQANHLEEVNNNIIDILGNVVESRSLESGTHIRRVKGFTRILGLQLIKDFPEYGLTKDQLEMITKAAALHDLGKIAIPDHILLKPGRLTLEEFEIMKTHTTKGCEMLDSIQNIWDEAYYQVSYEICRHHHEKYDGKGYPDGLKGEEIPLSAQLVSVADCYDALTTERCYKRAFTGEEAYHMIMNGECGAFSPKLLTSFTNARELFESYANKNRLVIE